VTVTETSSLLLTSGCESLAALEAEQDRLAVESLKARPSGGTPVTGTETSFLLFPPIPVTESV